MLDARHRNSYVNEISCINFILFQCTSMIMTIDVARKIPIVRLRLAATKLIIFVRFSNEILHD